MSMFPFQEYTPSKGKLNTAWCHVQVCVCAFVSTSAQFLSLSQVGASSEDLDLLHWFQPAGKLVCYRYYTLALFCPY